jgi:arginine utilization protein RocB
MLNCREQILALTEELVGVESVVNTKGEIDVARHLYQYLNTLPYFQENPDRLILSRTGNDEVERYNVPAFVKGTKRPSSKTVILMGHLDTVGIEDYNHLKDRAASHRDV